MLSMRELSRVYRTETVETSALDSVDLEMHAGEFVAIMGPSGCGKSTLLNVIRMLASPSSGSSTSPDHRYCTGPACGKRSRSHASSWS